MTQPPLPPDQVVSGLFTELSGLGVDSDDWHNAIRNLGTTTSLHYLAEVETAVAQLREYNVRKLLSQGYTWARIADALGVSVQAANRRYGHLAQHRRWDVGQSRK